MAETVNKKLIAKNTIVLYLRMLVSMTIGFYTSRVTLEYLGVTDYGIYQTVGGIVGLVAFVNSAISTGISRFITYSLGEGDLAKSRRLFSTILTTQAIFITILVLIAETAGLWLVRHKLVIPAETMSAAVFAYHLSVFTMALSMLANPFNAMIVAHERMNIYAYLSLMQSFAVLGVAFLLKVTPSGRLYLYSFILCIITAAALAYQVFYSKRHFKETSFRLFFDKTIFREVAGFSGWSLIAAMSMALNNQGILVVLNMFFAPAVVAEGAVSLTVNGAVAGLVGNFRSAMNPQIVKQYASGNYDTSKNLLLNSTKFSYYLLLIMAVPVFYLAAPLLGIWLKEVPEYSDIFLKLVIIQSLFQIFDSSFYMALYAKGQLRENALISPVLGLMCFPIVYILFKNGASPVALSWVFLIFYAILGVVVKPILLVKIVDYKWAEIMPVLFKCLITSVISFGAGYIIAEIFYSPSLWSFLLTAFLCSALTCIAIYFVGLNRHVRQMISARILVILNKNKSIRLLS